MKSIVLFIILLGLAIGASSRHSIPKEGRDLTPAETQQLDEQFPKGQYCTSM